MSDDTDDLRHLAEHPESAADLRERVHVAEFKARLFERIFNAIPDAVLVVRDDGQIVRINTAAEAIFGYDRHEFLLIRVEALVPLVLRATHAAHRADYYQAPRSRLMGKVTMGQLHAVRKDGSQFPCDVALSPLVSEAGLLTIAVVRDVSARAL